MIVPPSLPPVRPGNLEKLKGKRYIFQFYVDKAEARAAKATEDRDFERAGPRR